MKHQTKTMILLLSLFGIIVSAITVQGTMLGVGPSYIILKNALRGVEPYQETVYIYNEDKENHTIKLNSTGEIHSWTTFYEFSNTTIPINTTFVRNNSMKMIICEIFIPGDTANGVYNGTLQVSAKIGQINTTTKNTSQVELILPIPVSINVTGIQNINISVLETRIDEVEINFPSQISIKFKNTGNVRESPNVNVLITKDGRYIDEISSTTYTFPEILPGTIASYIMNWNTTGKISGNYTANISVTLKDNVIYQENKSFRLFPPGTFTRNGTLENITYTGELKKGTTLKIIATFLNTGEVDTTAKFLGEVYRDGIFIGPFESVEKTVQKYQEKSFESYVTLPEDGRYLIRGYILYEGRESNTKELTFDVGFILSNYYLIILFAVVACGIVGGVLYLRRKKIKHAGKESSWVDASKKQSKTKTQKKSRLQTEKNHKTPKIQPKKDTKKEIQFADSDDSSR